MELISVPLGENLSSFFHIIGTFDNRPEIDSNIRYKLLRTYDFFVLRIFSRLTIFKLPEHKIIIVYTKTENNPHPSNYKYEK
jgi:hypothetical protein